MNTVAFIADDAREFNLVKLREYAEWFGLRHLTIDASILKESRCASVLTQCSTAHELDEIFGDPRLCGIWCRGIDLASKSSSGSPENLLANEWKYYLNFLFRDVSPSLWMNAPDAIVRSSNRLSQLTVARNFGFKIPETLVTNRPEVVRAWFNRHRRIVVKQICGGGAHELADRALRTCLIDEDDEAIFEQVRFCPTLFQTYTEKDVELRVTVVGEQVFPAAIESQRNGQCAVDSRLYHGTGITYYRFELEQSVADKLIAIVKYYGLRYAAIDLILEPSGAIVFLEINPCGQWDFAEQYTGYAITEAMVRDLGNA